MRKKKPLFSSTDYQYSSLPTSRKEAFKDVYRHNFKNITLSGLMLLLFAVPLIVFLIFMDYGKTGMTLQRYSEKELIAVLLLWDIIVNVGVVVLLYVVLIALMGVTRVLKLLVWQEGIDFFYDFKVGIKENIKHFSLLYLFSSLLFLGTYFVYIFLLNFIIGIWLIILFDIVFVSLFLWALFVINVYQTTLWNYIKNAAFFFSRSILLTILFVILITFPFFSVFIPLSGVTIVVKYSLIIIMLVFYYPLMIIVGYLYSLSKFDTFINKDNYPEIYRKGLYDINKK